MESTTPLYLFVYGTLRSGECNHEHYCSSSAKIFPANVWGKRFTTRGGLPALRVPPQDIVCYGTVNPLQDAKTQWQLNANYSPIPLAQGDWEFVSGEVMVFEDPASDLPPLDALEGYRPSDSSLYERVLTPVFIDTDLKLVWLYQYAREDLCPRTFYF